MVNTSSKSPHTTEIWLTVRLQCGIQIATTYSEQSGQWLTSEWSMIKPVKRTGQSFDLQLQL